MDRRAFIRNLTGAVAALNLRTTASACGVSRPGLQLYTVRKNLEQNFERTLKQVADLGIREVEFAGYFGMAGSEIRRLLSRYDISAPSAHVDINLLRTDLAKVIDDAKTIGHKYLVLAYLPPSERKSIESYKKLADWLNETGQKCRRSGIRLAYHNHDFEFQPIGESIPFDLLLNETSPRYLNFELDLFWITKAGLDPVQYLDRYPGRFQMVHVKDMDSTPRKAFTEVGRGVIDFERIFVSTRRTGVKHYFIEQDSTPGDPLESIRISLDHLRTVHGHR